jgi:hypothetical protein
VGKVRDVKPVLTSSKEVTLDDLDKRQRQAREGVRVRDRIPKYRGSSSHFAMHIPWGRDRIGEKIAEEWMNAVTWWQQHDYVHPLTCRKNSSHKLLIAERIGNDVHLRCPTCGFVQTNIPECVKKLWRRRDTLVALDISNSAIANETKAKLEEFYGDGGRQGLGEELDQNEGDEKADE